MSGSEFKLCGLVLACILLWTPAGFGDDMTSSEALDLANRVSTKVFGFSFNSPRIEEKWEGEAIHYVIEEGGLRVVVDGFRRRIREITREIAPPGEMVPREKAEMIAEKFVEAVLGYLPEGRLETEGKSKEFFPHWKVRIVREKSGIPLGEAVSVWIWGDEVVSFLCSDIIDVDLATIPDEPEIMRDEAVRIAKRCLPGILRQAFDHPSSVELKYSYAYETVMEEFIPGHWAPMPRRKSNDLHLSWVLRFDNMVVIVDAQDGTVLYTGKSWKPHSYLREVGVLALLAGVPIITILLVRRFWFRGSRSPRSTWQISIPVSPSKHASRTATRWKERTEKQSEKQ